MEEPISSLVPNLESAIIFFKLGFYPLNNLTIPLLIKIFLKYFFLKKLINLPSVPFMAPGTTELTLIF